MLSHAKRCFWMNKDHLAGIMLSLLSINLAQRVKVITLNGIYWICNIFLKWHPLAWTWNMTSNEPDFFPLFEFLCEEDRYSFTHVGIPANTVSQRGVRLAGEEVTLDFFEGLSWGRNTGILYRNFFLYVLQIELIVTGNRFCRVLFFHSHWKLFWFFHFAESG